MLYTVVPLERIYADPKQFNRDKYKDDKKDKNLEDTEFKDVLLKNGRVVTRRVGESYVVQNMYSTDMSDYLNDEYSPGKEIKNKN